MDAQTKTLALIVKTVRALLPPDLDFVVLTFDPKKTEPIGLSSVMYPANDRAPQEQYERAVVAAREFCTKPPHLKVIEKPDPRRN